MQDITYENLIEKISNLFPRFLETEFYKNTDLQLSYAFFSSFMQYIIDIINQSQKPEENQEIVKAFELINYMIKKEEKLENLAVVEGVEWLLQEKKTKQIAEKMLSEEGKKILTEVSKNTGI